MLPRRLVPTLLVLVVLAGLLASAWDGGREDGSALATRRAEGPSWSVTTRSGQPVDVALPSEGLPLKPGQILWIDDDGAPDGSLSVTWRVQRIGTQSSFIDIRFGGEGADGYRAVVVPAASLVAYVEDRSGGAGQTLARIESSDALADPSAPFTLALRCDAQNVSLLLDDTELLSVARPADLRLSRVALWADGLAVLALDMSGAATWREDFATFASRPGLSLPTLLAGLGGLLLLGAWLRSWLPARPTLGELFETTTLAAAPLAIHPFLLPALERVLPPRPFWPELLAILLLAAGAGLARTRWITRLAAPARGDGRDTVRTLGITTLLVAGFVVSSHAVRQDRWNDTLASRAGWEADVSTQAFEHVGGPLTLDASNALSAPGPYRDVRIETRVHLATDAILEVRLRDQVALVLSSDPRLESSFYYHDPLRFELRGSAAPPVTADRTLELVVTARDTDLRADVDGRPLLTADDDSGAGPVTLLAVSGAVTVESLTVTPQPSTAPRAPPWWPTLITPLLALAALTALGMRTGRPALPALGTAAYLLVPATMVMLMTERTGTPPDAVRLGLATLGGLVLAWFGSARPGSRPLVATLLAGLSTPVLVTALLGPPSEPAGPAQVRHDVFPGERLLPGLVHHQHPAVRFANEWLKDHRLRSRSFTLTKPEGTSRVLALGSSSTWGHGLPDGLDWPTILEQLLRQRDPAARIEVLNGGIRSTSAARALRVFTEVLLPFDPDIVIVSFYFNDAYFLTQVDEDALFEDLVSGGDGARRRAREHVIEGEARLARLLIAQERGQDLAAVWRQLAGDEPSPPQRYEALLRRYVDVCARHDIDLILLKEPLRDDVPRLWKDEFADAVDRVAAEYALSVVDPRAALAAHDSDRMFMDIVHPLPPGCLVIAEELAPVVEALLSRR